MDGVTQGATVALGTRVEHEPTAAHYGAVRRFIVEHENRWTFILLYVGLAVTLSIFLSLFWLVALLAIHVLFELITHGPLHRGLRLAGEVLWAVKLDVALIFLAFSLALYLNFIFGLLGLRAAASAGAAIRGGTRVGARAAGWSKGIRATLLTADDAVQVVRATGKGTREPEGGARLGPAPWRHRWAFGEWLSVGLAVASIALVLLSPVLTDHTLASAAEALLHELRPIP